MTPASLRVLLVDDEALARRRLRTLLAGEPGMEIVGECADGAQAVSAIRELKPDLVFLDVQMPELDGFEVIERIGASAMPAVIFITAFDDYAVNAFEHGAVDYLLKPVEKKRFEQTLARARERVERRPAESRDQLNDLLRHLGARAAPARIGVKAGGKTLFVQTAEIFWIQARDDVARIHLAESFIDVREPLSRLESRLPAGDFLRVHRSAIVNVAHIREVQPFDQGDQMLVLGNGKRITTGRSYRQVMQDFLKSAT
jgi:two-component system, LytTR family, response regulator